MSKAQYHGIVSVLWLIASQLMPASTPWLAFWATWLFLWHSLALSIATIKELGK